MAKGMSTVYDPTAEEDEPIGNPSKVCGYVFPASTGDSAVVSSLSGTDTLIL